MHYSVSATITFSALLAVAPTLATPICTSGNLAAFTSLTDGCSIDNLIFDNFRYFSVPVFGTPVAVPASEVSVTPIVEPGRPGLSFAGSWTVTNGSIDYLIFYEIRTASGEPTISNAYLDWSFSRNGFSVASLDEFLCLGGTLTTGCMGTPAVHFHLRSSPVPSDPSDSVSFAPVSRVTVLKDVFVLGFPGSATISRADNQWGQVPEPNSMLLICCGVVALAVYRKARLS